MFPKEMGCISHERCVQRMSNMERTATLGKLPGSEFHVRALTSECRMNGGLWSGTPQNPLFSGYNFLSSNLNSEFERGGKKIHTAGC